MISLSLPRPPFLAALQPAGIPGTTRPDPRDRFISFPVAWPCPQSISIPTEFGGVRVYRLEWIRRGVAYYR